MSSPQRKVEEEDAHLGASFFPARGNCMSLMLLKLSKHRHLEASQPAPNLYTESMLDRDPKESK